jgi:hypothetical protein
MYGSSNPGVKQINRTGGSKEKEFTRLESRGIGSESDRMGGGGFEQEVILDYQQEQIMGLGRQSGTQSNIGLTKKGSDRGRCAL